MGPRTTFTLFLLISTIGHSITATQFISSPIDIQEPNQLREAKDFTIATPFSHADDYNLSSEVSNSPEPEMWIDRIDERRKRELVTNCTSVNCTASDPFGLFNMTEEEFLGQIRDFIFPRTWMWILIIMHTTVFVVGLMGNALVCVSVYRNHSMRTITNYFITNLAVADFMVLLFCLPPSLVWDVTMTWFFGVVMCKIVLYLQTVSVTVSVLTLTFISIDRWYAICYPLKFKSTTSRAKTAIIMIWMLALLFDIPELIAYETAGSEELKIDTIYFTQCAPNWSEGTETTWNIVKLVLLYLIPLLFMTVTYCQIVQVLWRSGTVNHHPLNSNNRSVNSFPNTNVNLEGQLRSRKKAAKMLVAVVVMFAVCYFPVHLLNALRIIIGLKNTDTNRAFSLVSHWLCYANSAVNPIIYNFMSGKFRKEFRRAVGCCTTSPSNGNYEMNSLYCKNTVKEYPNGSGRHFRSSRRTTRSTCAETNFAHRRSTKTSVVRLDM
ncbi:orexin/Hypocretin receptor type 1-like [Onthophagus taurus]|uniref:orexin/Hypocretin receptor type 1-like n=1 Tax=Onthophagus taurus TaxID=166361 RepID=UPI0039BDD453